MLIASHGQMRIQSVHPVHFSSCTSTTTRLNGLDGSASSFTIQSGCGITDMHASHPVQMSGLMEAISFDLGFLTAGTVASIKFII